MSENNHSVKNSCRFRQIAVPVLVFLLFFFLGFCILLAFSYLWLITKWGQVSTDEIIYELTASLEGTSRSMLWSYVLRAIIPSVAVWGAIVLFVLLHDKDKSPATKKKHSLIILGVSVLIPVIIVSHAWNRISLGLYIRGLLSESTFISDHYADPDKVKITFPEKKRNLLFIYLESMEVGYADKAHGGIFDENTIPFLTYLGQQNEMFTNDKNSLNGAHSLYGSTYTMGGMVATTSGLPIKRDVHLSSLNELYPGVTVLGDILKDEGYRQILLLGSDATFGGRRNYFSEHGNYEMHDYYYAKERELIPQDYDVWWGYEDEKLFEFAKQDLLQLSEEEVPFNYTLLTADTHFEDGYVCRRCGNEFGDDQYRNVISCSDRQVTEFILWVQQQPFYENTTIVITGDHPTMDSDLMQDAPDDYERKVYTAIINSAENYTLNRKRDFSTMDIFPTVLASLGAEISGDRLGLGTNLYSEKSTLLEESSVDFINRELNASSDFLSELLGFQNTRIMQNSEYSFHSYYDPLNEELAVRIFAGIFNGLEYKHNYFVISDDAGHSDKREIGEDSLLSLDLRDFNENLDLRITGENDDQNEDILYEYHRTKSVLAKERDIDLYFSYLKSLDDPVIMFSKTGDADENTERAVRDLLSEYEVQYSDTGFESTNYCAVLEDNVLSEKSSDERTELSGEFSGGKEYYLLASAMDNECSIAVDSIEYSQDQTGINIVVLNNRDEFLSASSYAGTDISESTIDIIFEEDPDAIKVYFSNEEDFLSAYIRIHDITDSTVCYEESLKQVDSSRNTYTCTVPLYNMAPENIRIDLFYADTLCCVHSAGVNLAVKTDDGRGK